jgi:hypothetical protein
MTPTGKIFISAVGPGDFIPTVWDPAAYRRDGRRHTLSDFAAIRRVSSASVEPARLPFGPLEYRDLPHGYYLSFALRPRDGRVWRSRPVVGEGELLFGTMRAYLGNVVVTPLAEWLAQKPPIYFHVKSEFVVVVPRDGLPYFWLAYLRSQDFLDNLPLGSGGTRPRLQTNTLGRMPVKVLPLKARKAMHEELKALARKEWRNCLSAASALASLKHGR